MISQVGLYRKIDTDFWDDEKVVEDFTKEDILVFIHLLSSDKSNLCGCYKITIKTISRKTKCTMEEVKKSLDHLSELAIIRYDTKTQEVLLLNYYRHSWTQSPKFRKGLENELEEVKTESFKEYIQNRLMGLKTRVDTKKNNAKPGSFNDFKQNEYDFNKMEKEIVVNDKE